MLHFACRPVVSFHLLQFSSSLKNPNTLYRWLLILHGIGKVKLHIEIESDENNSKEAKGYLSKKETSFNVSSLSGPCVCIPCHYSIIHLICIDDVCTLRCCILWCHIHKRLGPGLWVSTYWACFARVHQCMVHHTQLNFDGQATHAGDK